jgi:hypothetical protein
MEFTGRNLFAFFADFGIEWETFHQNIIYNQNEILTKIKTALILPNHVSKKNSIISSNLLRNFSKLVNIQT